MLLILQVTGNQRPKNLKERKNLQAESATGSSTSSLTTMNTFLALGFAAMFGALSGFALSGGLEAYAPSTQEMNIRTAELRLEEPRGASELSGTAQRDVAFHAHSSF